MRIVPGALLFSVLHGYGRCTGTTESIASGAALAAGAYLAAVDWEDGTRLTYRTTNGTHDSFDIVQTDGAHSKVNDHA